MSDGIHDYYRGTESHSSCYYCDRLGGLAHLILKAVEAGYPKKDLPIMIRLNTDNSLEVVYAPKQQLLSFPA